MSGEEGDSPRLAVTSCRVCSGRVAAAVDSGGTAVLVSQDGTQRPPFRFPEGGHLLQFLSCLENGLLPHGQLDPPLWPQRGKVSARGGPGEAALGAGRGEWPFLPPGPCAAAWAHERPTGTLRACRLRDRRVPGARPWGVFLQGKVFPKLRKRSPQGSSESTSSDKEDDEATDYVFRIIYPGTQSELGKQPWPSAWGVNPSSWS